MPNTPAGWAELATWLAQAGVKRVGIKATGNYQRGVALQRARNDRIDAVLIAACTSLFGANAVLARGTPWQDRSAKTARGQPKPAMFLGSAANACPSPRPAHPKPSRAGLLKQGRKPPRSALDETKHGGTVDVQKAAKAN